LADPRTRARELARESIARGDAIGWFDRLYLESERDGFAISWVDRAPNPYVVEWFRQRRSPPRGRAIIVGCGYGDDAEFLAAMGLNVVAFDVSPTAITHCRSRFPQSLVEYLVANVLEPPTAWAGAFDFVFEAYTVQVLRGAARAECARSVGRMVGPGGVLLAVARCRQAADPEGDMPWPLTRAELAAFLVPGLRLASLVEMSEPGEPPVPRFVAEFVARN
jgi:SAM-dependent methyltransferase